MFNNYLQYVCSFPDLCVEAQNHIDDVTELIKFAEEHFYKNGFNELIYGIRYTPNKFDAYNYVANYIETSPSFWNHDKKDINHDMAYYHFIKYCFPLRLTLNIIYNPKVLIENYISSNDKYNLIDGVCYINLEHRKDRKKHIEKQLELVGIPKYKIYRIDAVKHDKGQIGCTSSHIKTIEFAISKNWNNVLILEDDFTFETWAYSKLPEIFKQLFSVNPEYDTFFLAANKIQFDKFIHNNFKKMKFLYSSSGYLLNKKFMNTLLSNFKQSVHKLKNDKKTNKYYLDVYWNIIVQPNRWYIHDPKIGYQKENDYSDIDKCVYTKKH